MITQVIIEYVSMNSFQQRWDIYQQRNDKTQKLNSQWNKETLVSCIKYNVEGVSLCNISYNPKEKGKRPIL